MPQNLWHMPQNLWHVPQKHVFFKTQENDLCSFFWYSFSVYQPLQNPATSQFWLIAYVSAHCVIRVQV